MSEQTTSVAQEATPEVKLDTDMAAVVKKQREYFNSGATKSYDFRMQQLEKLKQAVEKHEENIIKALYEDLRKPEPEAWTTEVGITIAEIKHNMKNLRKWMRPEKVSTPLFFQPGSSRMYSEPYGVTLVISPWNFPFKNSLGPILASLSAGNTVILKPSEIAPATSKAMKKMVEEFFKPEYFAVVEGGVPETTELLKQRFDYILFTGGTEVGRIVYQAAAKHLTPVTLELGGKNPCIVDKDVDVEVAAKRIAWGKFLNAGQLCIAPNHVFVHQDIKQEFTDKLKTALDDFFGKDAKQSPDLGRIISDRHFERVKGLIEGDIIYGGESDAAEKYISPTLIDNVKEDQKVMQEEIFGPILPLIEFTNVDEVIKKVQQEEKPLILHIYSRNKSFQNKIIENTSSGMVAVNEPVSHAGHLKLPFGGVGSSGMGAYNARIGFDTFSHKKPVLRRSFLFDVAQKYPPIKDKDFNFLKFAIRKLL